MQTMAWVWIPCVSNNDLNWFRRLTDSNPNARLCVENLRKDLLKSKTKLGAF